MTRRPRRNHTPAFKAKGGICVRLRGSDRHGVVSYLTFQRQDDSRLNTPETTPLSIPTNLATSRLPPLEILS